MEQSFINTLEQLLDENDHSVLRKRIVALAKSVNRQKHLSNNAPLQTDFQQILEARTIERARYYIRRLIKGFTVVKTGKLNDLNLNRWKEYGDIITDSLWLVEKRDRSGNHSAEYWGNFVPQIPHQLIRRYTKAGEWVLDPFLGSGTTLLECKHLGRNGVGVELQPSVAKRTRSTLLQEQTAIPVRTEIITGNSSALDFKTMVAELGIPSVQLAVLHPPYWDIIRFSERKEDLSNAKSLQAFLDGFGKVVSRCASVLDTDRYLAVIIGDKYSGREWIPLGFLSMQETLKHGFKLKSIIVKNFNQTKGKRNQEELWRYRALVGGFYVFKHEYLFLFQKK